MWEKQKSHEYGTSLAAKIELGNQKTLNATIAYKSGYRYDQKPPYAIRMSFFIDQWEVKDYGFGPTVVRSCVIDFNGPRGVLFSEYEHEKRTIGPLSKVAAKYDTPEKVLALFYKVNPGYVPPEVEIPEIPAAIPAAV